MAHDSNTPAQQTLAHFRTQGWMRVHRAFDATTMRNVVWDALTEVGILRDDPSTWTIERPVHLQRLKHNPAFNAVGSEVLLAVIDRVLEGRSFEVPRDWGAFFLAFPGAAPWEIPTSGWHIDANYTSALWPVGGVKTFALLADVAPRGGGTLFVGGSHRLVHRWFRQSPPPPGSRSGDLRKLLMAHPYIRDLHTAGDPDERIERFMKRAEDDDGIALQIMEQTGVAGDVLLVHPLVMHVAAPNVTTQPRFLLSGGVTIDGWGWKL